MWLSHYLGWLEASLPRPASRGGIAFAIRDADQSGLESDTSDRKAMAWLQA